jgi:hypothetical protein
LCCDGGAGFSSEIKTAGSPPAVFYLCFHDFALHGSRKFQTSFAPIYFDHVALAEFSGKDFQR